MDETQNRITFEQFKEKIKEYESDTFSASGAELTPEEVTAVAEILLFNYFDNLLDGVKIANALDEVRGDEEDSDEEDSDEEDSDEEEGEDKKEGTE